MSKIKKEIFNRPTRFVHRFGEPQDPLGADQYFDMNQPIAIRAGGGSRQINVKAKGQYDYHPTLSPVCKPNGDYASIQGPAPDYADSIGMRPPVSTARRKVSSGAK